MKTEAFMVGIIQTNCYIAICQAKKEAVIIDPAFSEMHDFDMISRAIECNSLNVKYIINTHGHPDHTCGNGLVRDKYGVPILIHEYDAWMLGENGKKIAQLLGLANSPLTPDALVCDGSLIKFGSTHLKVLHTPGHSNGSISLVGKEECFTGDTLFQGSIGRTDLPGSSEEDMYTSLKKLADLPEQLIVYPGHGEKTTILKEKQSNPFLNCSI